ncbi:MAG: His/Gly/Thr/Pro-type tRNA ligase C-terminal domain-containing protein [Candidatus Pacebacteria bacterium]|jgi:prolyl-tRNA synthetase|nr:His/Gly/Thr/Pro-type tRNA ligase C-terminal domain-containing protein [Candidatus Paceibacterota bacterium]|tara:strand:+ start:42255 stop:43481 length:1227 start_codon:yes stop_codon:yes gene_type:complete
MLQSKLFTKTRKEAPRDEVSKNAQLLIRGSFIHKEMAGVYTYLPLGLRVLNNIENIIREEMNAIGGQEVLLTTLQDSEVWKKSGRWDDEVMDNWFKTKLKNGNELGIANTHEEPLSKILTDHVNSYKNLPLYVYQIQTKFRNELRAKSGIMRGREFLMKDLYSFSRNEEEHKEFYEKVAESYKKIFDRVGIGEITYKTFASGGSFSKFSDEFQTLSSAGEDTIYVDEEKKIAINKEVFASDVVAELGLDKDKLVEKKAIEVGNIFPLGTKYSEAEGLLYRGEDGKDKPTVMGSYGIGLGRVMGTVAEVLSDEKGLIWPESVAPFKVHLLGLSDAGEIYDKLKKANIEVLYDDREMSAGEKFADSDLIGIPYRVIVSDRNKDTGKFEFIDRRTGETKEITEEELFKLVS